MVMSKVKPSVKEIARIAEVSPGTVSNALNERPGVSEKTKRKIIAIAKELGYEWKHESPIKNQVIRIVIYKRSGHIVSDTPFFANLLEGMQKECRAANYEMLVTYITKGPDCQNQVEEIKSDNVAGYLIVATEMLAEDFALFTDIEKPIVFLDSYFPYEPFDFVLINNVEGAYQATKHLIDNGHKRIGYIHSSIYINNFFYRKQGFINALEDNGLNVDEDLWIAVEPTLDGAYRDLNNYLFGRNFPMPTAFFADNDIIAFGAMNALKEHGIKIPQDVSIVGFDDMPYCEISDPKITTVRVYKQQFGSIAIKRLIDKIQTGDQYRQKVEIFSDLVIRNSVRTLK